MQSPGEAGVEACGGANVATDTEFAESGEKPVFCGCKMGKQIDPSLLLEGETGRMEMVAVPPVTPMMRDYLPPLVLPAPAAVVVLGLDCC